MKFTLSTKPLKDALNLSVINANVSKYYAKSSILQLTATEKKLIINTEAQNIYTEISLLGVGETTENDTNTIMIDGVLFKQLISTIETNQICIEFNSNGITVVAGKSRFIVPKIADISDIIIQSPATSNEIGKTLTVSDWKFVKDHLMYAKSNDTNTPIYGFAWFGEDGNIIIGDYNISHFVKTTINSFGKTCLLSDTIINLFNSVPVNTTIAAKDDTFILSASTDAMNYTSQIKPMFESEDFGYYYSDIILGFLKPNADDYIITNVSELLTALKQANLLTSNKKTSVLMSVTPETITLKNSNMSFTTTVKSSEQSSEYSLSFSPTLLSSVLSNMSDDSISISPTRNSEGALVAITVSSNGMNVVLAGIDD